MSVHSSITNPNLRAFLALIKHTEGTDKYNNPYGVMFTGKTFSDLSKHPNIVNVSGRYRSTAAGAYQFLKRTYDSLGMRSMSQLEQDKGAIQLIKNCGAYENVINGNFESAINKTNKIWASFPNSPYGQPTKTMQVALAFLTKNKGKISIGILSIFFFALSLYLLIFKVKK